MELQRALGFIVAVIFYLLFKAGSVAMGVWLAQAAPAFTARAVNAYQTRGKWCFFLGLVNAAVFIILAGILLNAKLEPLKLPGVVLLFALVGLVTTGYTLSYHDLGQRLRGDVSPRATLIGGLAAETAFMAPVLGQLFSIAVLFRGLGAVVSAMMGRRPAG